MESNNQTRSKNMNYIYNVEYFDWVELEKNNIDQVNAQICNFKFPQEQMFQSLDQQGVYGKYLSFDLYTMYPGLLIGTGNLHDIRADGAYKLGFSFDYVNGLPYLPGSSLKGLLRSVFPSQHLKTNKEGYVCYLTGMLEDIKEGTYLEEQIDQLERAIFDYQDVFLGAYPVTENADRSYLATEYVTPHKELKNPNPISFVKVKPNVCFRFHFLLRDNEVLTAEEQLKLFKNLILEFGVGAKTNVGFGKFSEKKNNEQLHIEKAPNNDSHPMNRQNNQHYSNGKRANNSYSNHNSYGNHNNRHK